MIAVSNSKVIVVIRFFIVEYGLMGLAGAPWDGS